MKTSALRELIEPGDHTDVPSSFVVRDTVRSVKASRRLTRTCGDVPMTEDTLRVMRESELFNWCHDQDSPDHPASLR